jgi:inosine-uridine nucleoside N-ribohydrolase
MYKVVRTTSYNPTRETVGNDRDMSYDDAIALALSVAEATRFDTGGITIEHVDGASVSTPSGSVYSYDVCAA